MDDVDPISGSLYAMFTRNKKWLDLYVEVIKNSRYHFLRSARLFLLWLLLFWLMAVLEGIVFFDLMRVTPFVLESIILLISLSFYLSNTFFLRKVSWFSIELSFDCWDSWRSNATSSDYFNEFIKVLYSRANFLE